jgi:hypothetical protein
MVIGDYLTDHGSQDRESRNIAPAKNSKMNTRIRRATCEGKRLQMPFKKEPCSQEVGPKGLRFEFAE